MPTHLSTNPEAKALLKPEERLALSRSEIVNFMQKNNQILDILKPFAASYVSSNPVKTLAISAGVGAAMIVLKPWRLITLGSLLTVLKLRK